MKPTSENELYASILCGHLREMVYRLRQIPAAEWDHAPALPAPTPRILATHAYQWLVCDRQHIAEPDVTRHALVPDAPADPAALCDALAQETENWDRLIRSLTPGELDQTRRQFGWGRPMNVRGFVAHMIQNSIYKNGQLATIYFALGLDGTAPYDAPFPNPIYQESWDTLARPLHRASLDGDLAAVQTLLADPATNVNETDARGLTPLICAAWRGHEQIADALLARGADPGLRERGDNATAADFARFGGHEALATRLAI